MRQQLIEWLIDDVAPRVRRTGDPEGELVKFANEKNLSPALLEGLAQLFNTAKTLSFMDKSANRGESFPLVDVQNLVSQYVEVPATKLANDPDGWLQTDAKLKPAAKMPSFFELPENDGLEFEMDKAASVTKAATPRRPENPMAIARSNMETLSQVRFDCEQEARYLLDRFVKRARQGGVDFARIELDSMAILGEDAKPALDQTASYLASHGFPVKRAAYDGKPRLVDSPETVEIEFIAKAIGRIKEADVMEKEMADEYAKVAHPLADDEEGSSPKAPVRDTQGSRGPSVTSPVALPKFEMGDASKSPLKTAPDAMFELLRPSRDFFFKNVAKHLTTPDNSHLEVDNALNDAQHLSLLQNLMTTDDVLSEADPDTVVSAYNTIRQTAPDLAKDINVMRVALRSAVQHEGIDPFTIKGIAETELARQKVQHGISQQRDRAKGKPAPVPAGKE